MKSVTFLLAGLVAIASVVTPAASYAQAPEQIIADRKANQKRVGDLSDEIKKGIAAGATLATLLPAVKELDDRTHLIKGYFPEGTETGGGTKARPEIWTDRAGFNTASDNYVAAFDKVLALAQAGDSAGFATQFSSAGATCGACHRAYRAR